MSRKHNDTEAATASLKNESARQRWELFHRAIAHAKRSNHESVREPDNHNGDGDSSGPLLSIVR